MSQQLLCDLTLVRTADSLMQQFNAANYKGASVDIWLFEGRDKRLTMMAELEQRGVHARVHSAYKPLVCFFLEQVQGRGLQSAHIVYPRHTACVENRFLLEAYPLPDLFPDASITFAQATDAGSQTMYAVTLKFAQHTEEHQVFAPNVLKDDFLGQTVYTPSAWLRVTQHGQLSSQPIAADYEQAYQAVISAVAAYDWGRREPYFDRLTITLNLPGIEQKLAYGHETISTTEAMHEEIYFSLLEYFQHYSGREPGSRGLQPGQIIPDIRLDNQGPIQLKVALVPAGSGARHVSGPLAMTVDQQSIQIAEPLLDQTQTALSPLAIAKALQSFKGLHFAFNSAQGRAVNGVYIQGARPAVVISGAQHANETSGVVGALRAAQQLSTQAGAHFALLPLENPDGYALQATLCATNPTHMQHAARYTALGDDLEYREHAPWFEREARNHAFTLSQAQLHLNLHGYPAHEWTRPCTGYLPRGFELWSIPKGFFLILRYKAVWRTRALALLQHITQDLANNPELMAYNTQQMESYQRYGGTIPFQVLNGVPYTATEVATQEPGITLVTEFPDETISGDEFVLAHSVQMQTVLAACSWWWDQAPFPGHG
ncbi:MAG: peptidase M14 [Burkholderiaceae bacterium]|nr:peptidase M14 [Burkholderiaceae bacterium]